MLHLRNLIASHFTKTRLNIAGFKEYSNILDYSPGYPCSNRYDF